MRIGMVGLSTLYWPVCMGNGLSGNSAVEFVSAADLSESEANVRENLGMTQTEYCDKYGLKLYSDPVKMVKAENLDAVVIATRHTGHAELAERMAALGVDIFIPKTFATTMEDAGRILEAEKKFGIRIASGPTARYIPQIMAVKQAVDAGCIGKPFALRICHHHGTIDCFHKNDWYRDPAEGGPELSLGWYGIDLALQLMGRTVKTVYAVYGNYTTPDSPFMDCGNIEMKMEDGAIAVFNMYFCNRVPYPSWQMEVAGPEGVISIHRAGSGSCDTVVTLDSAEGSRQLPVPGNTPHWEHFWIDEFVKGNTPTVTAEYAKLVTQISLAARESALKGHAISLA